MPIVAGNQPESEKQSGGFGCGWVIMPLILFGRPLYNMIQRFINGRLTDEQFWMIVGGICLLVALAAIVQRVNRLRQSSASSLPTTALPSSTLAASLRQLHSSGEPYLPPAPRFEPIITGKVVLAGIVLAFLLGGVGLFLLMLL